MIQIFLVRSRWFDSGNSRVISAHPTEAAAQKWAALYNNEVNASGTSTRVEFFVDPEPVRYQEH
jgi:hypothetical protein